MKMEPIEGSEMSAIINQTRGNYPKGNLLCFVYCLCSCKTHWWWKQKKLKHVV